MADASASIPLRSYEDDPDFSHPNVIYRFRAALRACRRVSKIDQRPFYLDRRLAIWFHSKAPSDHGGGGTNARQLLNAVFASKSAERHMRFARLEKAMNDDQQCWLSVFTILVHLDLGELATSRESLDNVRFQFSLMLEWCWPSYLCDRQLPIAGEQLEWMCAREEFLPRTDAKEFARKFKEVQCQLCARDTLNNLDNKHFDAASTVIPINSMEPIKPDSNKTSNIFQVEVPVECIPRSLEDKIDVKPFSKDNPPGEYQQFAVKILGNAQDYEREKLAYGVLAESKVTGNRMFVQCLGTWTYTFGNEMTLYYLLLEWGEYDLDDHFATISPPATADGILKFWNSLLLVTSTLSEIHTTEFGNAENKYYGWHGDLKPENILFCQEGRVKGLKIGDPGFAKFLAVEKVELDNDGLPVTLIDGGTITYGGPERSTEKPETIAVSPRFDIWSLGCVFSEAATWLVLGGRAVRQYRNVRFEIEGCDSFHKSGKVSDTVLEWHKYLRQALKRCDSVTERVLGLVEDHMLKMPAKDRITAKDLAQRMIDILDPKNCDGSTATENGCMSSAGAVQPYQLPKPFLTISHSKPGREVLASTRSIKFKSTRFFDTMREQLELSNASSIDIVALDFDGGDPEIGDNYGGPGANSTRGVLDPASIHSSVKVHGLCPKRHMSSEGGGDGLTFWDARKLLEGSGWKSGSLIPPDHHDRTAPGAPSQASSFLSRSITNTTAKTPRRIRRSFLHKTFALASRASRRPTLSSGTYGKVLPAPITLQTSPDSSQVSLPSSQTSLRHLVRCKDFAEQFDGRDIIFLVDNEPSSSTDGLSMSDHWPYAKELLAVLVAFLYGRGDNGMDLYFTSGDSFRDCRLPSDFITHMTEMAPKRTSLSRGHSRRHSYAYGHDGRSGSDHTSRSGSDAKVHDIRRSIRAILNDWSDAEKGIFRSKMTLIVLTDGVWRGIGDKGSLATQIVALLEPLLDEPEQRERVERRDLSIQFIRFGNDPEATEVFDQMDNNLKSLRGAKLPDIVDHEPADGNIIKMMLGSICGSGTAV